MAQIETWFSQDLKQAVRVHYIDGNVFSADNNGNIIGVNVFDDGEPAALGGTVSASIIRADGATVSATGTLSGNQVSVSLPQSAYAVPGVISVVLKLTSGTDITTLLAVVGNVYQSTTDTVVDPGTIIPSIETLIAAIEAAVASIPADYSDLWTSLAPAFSTSTAYTAGQYVTYNGGLYRFTVDHAAGSWNSAHVTAVNFGGEVYDLKSTFQRIDKTLSDNLIMNLFDPSTITEGKYKKASDGTIGTNATWFYSDLIHVIPGVDYIISGNNVLSSQIAFYASEAISSFVSGATGVGNDVIVVTAPAGANYMTLSGAIADADSYVIVTNEYLPGFTYSYKEIDKIKQMLPLNLFNKDTIVTGKYKRASDGGIGNSSVFFYSDLIPVVAGETYYLNKNNQCQLAFYATPMIGSFVSGLAPSGTARFSFVVPANAKYMTLSGYIADAPTLWITKGFTSNTNPSGNMVEFFDSRYNTQVEELTIEVGTSGYDYTSVLEAVEFVRNNNIVNAIVKIHPGTYDLIAELVALRGQSFIDNYTSSEYTSPTGLKGIFLGNNIKIIGDNPTNTKIVCRYTGSNTSFKSDWSVFHVYNNQFTLSGLTVVANNVRYCVHDDGRVIFGNETGIIENCTFINEFLNYGALIGAGLWGDAARYIRNCQFINHQSNQAEREAISYHPNTGSNACEVHIDNIYCEACGVNIILGEAADISTMYVSNSKMNRLPYVSNPTSEYQYMNLIYWNIEVTT